MDKILIITAVILACTISQQSQAAPTSSQTSSESPTPNDNIDHENGQPLGAPCGGFWYNHGPCAEGLTCQKTVPYTDTPGECVEDEDYDNNYGNYFDYLEQSSRPVGQQDLSDCPWIMGCV